MKIKDFIKNVIVMTLNELSKIVFESGLKIHREIGPGLLESTYEKCLAYELGKRGLRVERQVTLPLKFGELIIPSAYRVDLFVERKLIIEMKTVSELTDLHLAQLLTYLKLSDCNLGLLINFNVPLFKNGVRRVVNGYLDNT